MRTLAHQHRIRAAAIGKKGELESAMLMESELVITTKTKQYHVDDMSASPVSVASLGLMMPAMNSLPGALEAIQPLPGAWTVVGKGGRPLKDGVMYIDAPSPDNKKKKKRNRTRKVPASDNDANVLADLAEAPTSSTCEQMVHRSTTRRQKEVGKHKDLKLWQQYRQDKTTKVLARDTLVYVLAHEGMLGEEASESALEMSAPEAIPRRHDKVSSRWANLKAKLRRQARFESATARCYSAEEPGWIEAAAQDERKPSVAATATAVGEENSSSSERWSLDADVEREHGKSAQAAAWAVPTSWAWTTVSSRKAKRDTKSCSVA